MSQTDPQVESKGVNTKLKSGQQKQKSHLLTPASEQIILCQRVGGGGEKITTVEVVPPTQVTTLQVSNQNSQAKTKTL